MIDYGGFGINVDVLESILDGNLKSLYIFSYPKKWILQLWTGKCVKTPQQMFRICTAMPNRNGTLTKWILYKWGLFDMAKANLKL